MNFNNHSKIKGCHAFLSASQYHWINYTPEKLRTTFNNKMMAAKGTELHDLAEKLIRQKVKLPDTNKTLNSYVNDAIGYGMTPEQIVFVSENCFGTVDALYFDERRKFLRIHDLKTGIIPAKITQLIIYAAMFCIEYNYRPAELDIELRIYQNDEIEILTSDDEEIDLYEYIEDIMGTIKEFDILLKEMKAEVM